VNPFQKWKILWSKPARCLRKRGGKKIALVCPGKKKKDEKKKNLGPNAPGEGRRIPPV